MEGYDREFYQFSDQLRLQTAAFSGLSLGDSIWSPAGRRNNSNDVLFAASASPADAAAKSNAVVGLKLNDGGPGLIGSGKLAFGGGAGGGGTNKADRYNNNNLPNTDNKTVYNTSSSSFMGNGSSYAKNNNNNADMLAFDKMGSYGYNGGGNTNNNSNGVEVKSYFNKSAGRAASNNNNNNNSHAGGGNKKGGAGEYGRKKHAKSEGAAAATDKQRFKTLPASEALPRGQAIGGYIFVCNNDTMDENLRRELFGERYYIIIFGGYDDEHHQQQQHTDCLMGGMDWNSIDAGLPSRYRDSVRAIRPGLPLFLYNYSTHQLHGIFEVQYSTAQHSSH
jgi:hypothetical protein